jgi:tetratricopeptide (TPR) repeat protein
MTTSSQGATTKQMFQSWELTGRGRVKGVWPIPAGLQPDLYTEVEINTRSLIVGVREFREGHPDPLVRKFTYDKHGRVQFQEYSDPLTGLAGKNNYFFNKRGLLEKRDEVDAKGKIRYIIEVKCDENGRLQEEKVMDALKRPTMRHVYHYDGAGNLVKDETFVGKTAETLQGYHALVYDDKAHILRRAWCTPDGQEVNAFVYKYDQYDRRVEMAIETGGVRSTTCVYEFDKQGKRVGSRYVGSDDKEIKLGPDPSQKPMTVAEIAAALQEGQETLAKVAKQDPKKLDAIAQVAYSQFETGVYDEARKLFESLSTIDPANPYYLAGVAATALMQDQPQTAMNYYERALMRDPNHTMSLVGKADALLRLGKVDDALKAFAEAFKKASKKDDPALRRARAIVTAISQGAQGAGK